MLGLACFEEERQKKRAPMMELFLDLGERD